MGIAYIKIHKISGVKPSVLARYELSATLMSDNTIISPVLLTVSEHNNNQKYLKTDNVWSLPFERIMQDDGISLTLMKGKNKYKNLCKLNLPLTWFQVDCVVREDFPMHYCNNSSGSGKDEVNKGNHNFQKDDVFIDMSVHISTRGVDPFEDPKGSLTVRPAWKKGSTQNPPAHSHHHYPAQPQYGSAPPNFMQPIQIMQQRVAPPPGIPQITAGPALQVFSQPLYPFNPTHQPLQQPLPQTSYIQQQPHPQQPIVQTQQPPHHQTQQIYFAPNQQFVIQAQQSIPQQEQAQMRQTTKPKQTQPQNQQNGNSLIDNDNSGDLEEIDNSMTIGAEDAVHFQPVTIESANAANIRKLSETQVPLLPQ